MRNCPAYPAFFEVVSGLSPLSLVFFAFFAVCYNYRKAGESMFSGKGYVVSF